MSKLFLIASSSIILECSIIPSTASTTNKSPSTRENALDTSSLKLG